MKIPLTLLSIVILLLSSCNRRDQVSVSYIPTFILSSTSPIKINQEQSYQFGYLEVPENRSIRSSRMIKLPVYIFKSRNPNPKPDPIIYTVGGPGSTTMTAAPYMNYYRYLDDRDFILFEQRGNYYAEPHLDCPEWSEAIYRSNLPGFDPSQKEDLLATAATNCRKRLLGKGIDLNGYNTNEIAADLADLRKALNIREYNLLTISYSTKIAQVLLRDYPEGIRSVVMDSPLPLESKYDEESNANLMEAVERLLADCAADPACQQRFPKLQTRFFNYLEKISDSPLAVKVENPDEGKQETFYLRGKDLMNVFSNASTAAVPNIPLGMEKIINGDLSAVKEQLVSLFAPPGIGDGIGMRLSVWCAEEYPFSSQATIAAETNKYAPIEGLSPAVFEDEICKIWSVKKVKKLENKAVKSKVPVLLINGQYDEQTPPKWAAAMQSGLSNSFHLVFPAWKHTPTTNWSNPCAMQAANDFFNAPKVRPNPPCLGQIKEVKFNLE
jgi:pimeloyl-ACP methyl ester carboxylesterase